MWHDLEVQCFVPNKEAADARTPAQLRMASSPTLRMYTAPPVQREKILFNLVLETKQSWRAQNGKHARLKTRKKMPPQDAVALVRNKRTAQLVVTGILGMKGMTLHVMKVARLRQPCQRSMQRINTRLSAMVKTKRRKSTGSTSWSIPFTASQLSCYTSTKSRCTQKIRKCFWRASPPFGLFASSSTRQIFQASFQMRLRNRTKCKSNCRR